MPNFGANPPGPANGTDFPVARFGWHLDKTFLVPFKTETFRNRRCIFLLNVQRFETPQNHLRRGLAENFVSESETLRCAANYNIHFSSFFIRFPGMTVAIPGIGKLSSAYTGIYGVRTIPPVYTGIWAGVVARQCARCWKWVMIIYTMNVSALKSLGRPARKLSLSRTCERERRAREAMDAKRAREPPFRARLVRLRVVVRRERVFIYFIF